MNERIAIQRGRHRDSVTLMLASREAATVAGVAEAYAVSATPINLELLGRSGFELAEDDEVSSSDLVIAVRASSEAVIEEALAVFEQALTPAQPATSAGRPIARSLPAAARRRPGTNLAVLSVPGSEAAHECAMGLAAGLHVFCFSSGFGHELERALKRQAVDRGLLMMGPDCGTAILDSVGVGFSNAIDRGPVGIVGASGTGMQQISCLLDAAGIGVSQAIGVGGRDLDERVGGLMTLHAIELLATDPDTEVITVIAKSPDASVAERVADAVAAAGKPAILCFPGFQFAHVPSRVEVAGTLEDTARIAAAILDIPLELDQPVARPSGNGLLRGLFSGGTLRDEALAIVASTCGEAPVALGREPGPEALESHLLIDYGSELLTAGRVHPMIDPSLRDAAMLREGSNPRVSVLLVDVVLGRGSHPDPAAGVIQALTQLDSSRPDPPTTVVSLCGARRDSQGLDASASRLREAGAVVSRSNAQAARLAAAMARHNATAGTS